MAEIIVSLTDAQVEAVALLGVEPEGIAASAIASAIKGKLNYYRNGATVKSEGESTHSVTKNGKTIYYKGGLKQAAIQAFNMSKAFLSKELTQGEFVNNALAEVDAVIARLGAKEENGNEVEE